MKKNEHNVEQIYEISKKAEELNRELSSLDEAEQLRLLDFIRGYALACERQKQLAKKQDA